MESAKAMLERQQLYKDQQYSKHNMDKFMIVSVLTLAFSFTAFVFVSLFWSSVSLQSSIFNAIMMSKP
jgi:hypothetical protein